MKTTKQIFALLLTFAVLAIGCKKEDDDPTTPTVSFEQSSLQVYENQSGEIRVKVNLSEPTQKQVQIPIEVTGTAVAGTNYQIGDTQFVTIDAGALLGEVILQPKISTTSEDYTLTITLKQAAGFIVDPTKNTFTLTILDSQKSNLTKVSFANTNEVITNPLLAEAIEVKVALTELSTKDIVVPITITGATEGVDFTTEGLESGSIRIPANALEASFKVKIKSADIVAEKAVDISISGDTPNYIVDKTKNAAKITLINPEVNFGSSFFTDANLFKFFFLSNGTSTQYDAKTAYNMKGYRWNGTTSAFATASGQPYINKHKTIRNAWDVEVHNWFKKQGWSTSITIPELERWEIQTGDLLNIASCFPANYLAEYAKTTAMIGNGNCFLKFIPTQKDGLKGVVTIPTQDLTVYKAKPEFKWFEYTVVSTKNVYNWYADSRATNGNLAASTNVEPVTIKVENAVGTYDLTTTPATIQIDVTLSSADTNFAPADATVYSKADGKYTIRYKFTPNK
ncbi:hypothetical protein [Acetobacteroides hydrogenigenes]|uniref:Calx-beta domain-containing protein n=1 Tax=Acetobacteroides hydrogenigenes TaxID=979970 RepID=A0A4R2ED16_9BACT|nr:hypothetical protein [Acetobacteroides hydrogenigenes]TCN64752.1 hypothetical protein CLV25_11279 [Acetobacteroides hydrogenigenes]